MPRQKWYWGWDILTHYACNRSTWSQYPEETISKLRKFHTPTNVKRVKALRAAYRDLRQVPRTAEDVVDKHGYYKPPGVQ